MPGCYPCLMTVTETAVVRIRYLAGQQLGVVRDNGGGVGDKRPEDEDI